MVGDSGHQVSGQARRFPSRSRYPRRSLPWAVLPGPPTTRSPGHVGPSAADKNIGRAAVKPRAASGCVRAGKPRDAAGSCGQQRGQEGHLGVGEAGTATPHKA
ncbi:hypothetical protein E2C01_058155 [Portunus trituberculatus]|uniref:Uncharacterized protein n=1 Tax=Portunus trituberculatus TaxID=210409 RepID=A0A5B7H2Z6_PORTR|nr:hypothetical protein [Portunus trituberculatus]